MGYFGIFCNINNVIKQKLSKLSMNLEAEFKKKEMILESGEFITFLPLLNGNMQ